MEFLLPSQPWLGVHEVEGQACCRGASLGRGGEKGSDCSSETAAEKSPGWSRSTQRWERKGGSSRRQTGPWHMCLSQAEEQIATGRDVATYMLSWEGPG